MEVVESFEDNIPTEILGEIFFFLSPKDLYTAFMVCRRWESYSKKYKFLQTYWNEWLGCPKQRFLHGSIGNRVIGFIDNDDLDSLKKIDPEKMKKINIKFRAKWLDSVVQDYTGVDPLSYSVIKNRTEISKYLIETGVFTVERDSCDENENIPFYERHLHAKSSPKALDVWTTCVLYGRLEILKYLFEKGYRPILQTLIKINPKTILFPVYGGTIKSSNEMKSRAYIGNLLRIPVYLNTYETVECLLTHLTEDDFRICSSGFIEHCILKNRARMIDQALKRDAHFDGSEKVKKYYGQRCLIPEEQRKRIIESTDRFYEGLEDGMFPVCIKVKINWNSENRIRMCTRDDEIFRIRQEIEKNCENVDGRKITFLNRSVFLRLRYHYIGYCAVIHYTIIKGKDDDDSDGYDSDYEVRGIGNS